MVVVTHSQIHGRIICYTRSGTKNMCFQTPSFRSDVRLDDRLARASLFGNGLYSSSLASLLNATKAVILLKATQINATKALILTPAPRRLPKHRLNHVRLLPQLS